MRNAMAMVSGILLAVAVCLSGCIVSATPDTETVIEVRAGQTIEFKVSGLVNTPTSKCVWQAAKMNGDYVWPYGDYVTPYYDTMLERSDTFKLTVDPDGERTNRIRVRCVIYTYILSGAGGPGTGCPFIFGCWSWYPSDSSRSWDIRILQDTAPVWQGNYHIRDSRDLELLKDYTTVSGSLVMNGKHIKNLEGIENLTSIGGSLCIEYNDALTSLSGLRNITSVPGYLSIGGNTALKSLSGLENLTSVGGFYIWNNAALTSLSGLENLTSFRWLDIMNNDALTSLSGLENLTSVDGSLDFEDNDALTSLSGLEGLTSVSHDLEIEGHDALTNLSGLENLTRVGWDLVIFDNDALTALGMTGLQRVGDDFSIVSNSSLCRSLAEELMVQVLAGGGIGGEVRISGNMDCISP